MIIKGTAYDVTNFIDSHPGGSAVILKYAGQDATDAFEPIHPSDTLQKYLTPNQNMGLVTGPSPPDQEKKSVAVIAKEKRVLLSSIINIRDLEIAASKLLPPRSFACESLLPTLHTLFNLRSTVFKTGANDEYTAQWNRSSWHAIRFRPRILRPIDSISLSTTILGTNFSAPFFICPAGGGKLAHPEGEVLMTKAAAKHDILHWVCNMAGCSQQEMSDARVENQTQYWQIYVMSDLEVTEREVRKAVELGYGGFALTVDAVRAGKRERDLRMRSEELDTAEEEKEDIFTGGPTVKRA
jgi:L-lactate dehydrogenase (cytochrome)